MIAREMVGLGAALIILGSFACFMMVLLLISKVLYDIAYKKLCDWLDEHEIEVDDTFVEVFLIVVIGGLVFCAAGAIIVLFATVIPKIF